MRRYIAALILCPLYIACPVQTKEPKSIGCKTSSDCESGKICVKQKCQDKEPIPSKSVRCKPLKSASSCPSISACDSVLSVIGYQSTHSGSEQTKQRSYLKSFFCESKDYRSIYEKAVHNKDSGGVGVEVGATIPFKGILIGGSVGVDHNWDNQTAEKIKRVKDWQQKYCRKEINSLSIDSVKRYLSKIIDNRSNIDAWSKCVSQTIKAYEACQASQNDPVGLMLLVDKIPTLQNKLFQIVIRWCGSGGQISFNEAIVTRTFLVQGDASCKSLDALAVGKTLQIGKWTIPCERTGNGAVQATLNVKTGSKGAFLNYTGSTYLRAICGKRGEICCPKPSECAPQLICRGGSCIGKLGAPCEQDSDCDTSSQLKCLEAGGSEKGKTCNKRCNSDKMCPGETVCEKSKGICLLHAERNFNAICKVKENCKATIDGLKMLCREGDGDSTQMRRCRFPLGSRNTDQSCTDRSDCAGTLFDCKDLSGGTFRCGECCHQRCVPDHSCKCKARGCCKSIKSSCP